MDAEQFEQAVAEHQRMVFSIALHALRDRALAEDTAQDVFLALYRHGAGIGSTEHLVHWLRRVTARKCIDHIRRLRWRRWLRLSDVDGAAAASSGADRGDPLLSERLRRLMRALPAVARLALVLRYQEDLQPAEIGRVLGVSEGAVKKELRRALAQLKLRLKAPVAPEVRGPAATPGDRGVPPPGRNLRACLPAGAAAAFADRSPAADGAERVIRTRDGKPPSQEYR